MLLPIHRLDWFDVVECIAEMRNELCSPIRLFVSGAAAQLDQSGHQGSCDQPKGTTGQCKFERDQERNGDVDDTLQAQRNALCRELVSVTGLGRVDTECVGDVAAP